MPEERVDAAVVAEAVYSGFEERARMTIADAEEWESALEWLRGAAEPVPAAPAVDWTREMVLLAAMGSRPTGGHSIAVDSVRRADGGLVVYVTESSPGAGCITTQAFTAPAVAVRVPRVDGQIRFVDRTRVRGCG